MKFEKSNLALSFSLFAALLVSPVLFADRENSIEKLVLSKRKAPVTNFAVSRTLFARDFGMKADDVEDDHPGVLKLLAELKSNPIPTEVLFDPGTYHLNPFGGKTPASNDFHCLDLCDVTNVILRGRGCAFLIHNPQAGFIRVLRSERIIIQDMSVDYDPLPLSQGTIRSVDGKGANLVVEIEAGFPLLDAPHMIGSHLPGSMYVGRNLALIMDEKTRTLRRGVGNVDLMGGLWWNAFSNEDGLFRLKVERPEELRGVVPGNKLAFLTPRRPIGVIRPVQSSCVTLLRITAYTSPNTVFSGVRVSEYNVLYCNLLRKNGRLLTSNADTLTVFSYGRLGLWVEGCHFEGALDDVMQPEGFKCAIDSVVDDHRLKVRGLTLGATPDAVIPGDTLFLFNARNAAPLWEGKVASVDLPGNTIAFVEKIPERGILPVDVKNGGDLTLLYNKDASTAYFVIRSNTFSNTIGNTFVSHVPKAGGIFEGNILANTTMGVNFANHASWTYYPGYPKEIYLRIASNAEPLSEALFPDAPVYAENILIRGNQFIGGYASPKTYKENMGAVSFFLYGGAWKLPARTIGYSNLVIVRNDFVRYPGKYAVRIHNATGVFIGENRFDTTLPPDYANTFAGEDRFAIGLAYSTDIEIRGNQTSDPKSLVFAGEKVQGLDTSSSKKK